MFTAWMAGSAIALISCAFRRYRDTGKSLWYLSILALLLAVSAITKTGPIAEMTLLIFIPIFLILVLFLTFWPSSKPSLRQFGL